RRAAQLEPAENAVTLDELGGVRGDQCAFAANLDGVFEAPLDQLLARRLAIPAALRGNRQLALRDVRPGEYGPAGCAVDLPVLEIRVDAVLGLLGGGAPGRKRCERRASEQPPQRIGELAKAPAARGAGRFRRARARCI